MGQSTLNAKPFATSLLWLQNQRLQAYLATAKSQLLSDVHSNLLVIPNHPPPSKPTIPQQITSCTQISAKNDPRLGICTLIGYAIAVLTKKLISIGIKAATTLQIISPNIILPLIIKQNT